MTRGTAWYLTLEGVLESIEFNGDMYPEKNGGLGDSFLNGLKDCKSEKDFHEFIKKFNRENHNYDEKLTYSSKANDFFDKFNPEESSGLVINLSKNYFDRFFSDWIFFKNATNLPIIFICYSDIKEEVILEPGKSIRFDFGEYYNEEA